MTIIKIINKNVISYEVVSTSEDKKEEKKTNKKKEEKKTNKKKEEKK